ncbi:beta-lactamase hydrolase domain-containing protein, partial [Rhizobium johnstonii]|uniref:beta-lactamase hydrolase domain-containing protein n=1 Tax=Rhizobium johnstonii TaxID=3019933 RepID=UPI003F9BF8B6
MEVRQGDDEYSVSGQITLEELDESKALGFKAIVCHRPDHESPDQTSFSVIEARTKDL